MNNPSTTLLPPSPIAADSSITCSSDISHNNNSSSSRRDSGSDDDEPKEKKKMAAKKGRCFRAIWLCGRSLCGKWRFRASCVPFKGQGNQMQILLVSSSKHENDWVLPGGGMERGEKPEAAATREVLEEAGVRGDVIQLLGWCDDKHKWTRTAAFSFSVTLQLDINEWEEGRKGRTRRWVSITEAGTLLRKPIQQTQLKLFIASRPDLAFLHSSLTSSPSSVTTPVAAATATTTLHSRKSSQSSSSSSPRSNNAELGGITNTTSR